MVRISGRQNCSYAMDSNATYDSGNCNRRIALICSGTNLRSNDTGRLDIAEIESISNIDCQYYIVVNTDNTWHPGATANRFGSASTWRLDA